MLQLSFVKKKRKKKINIFTVFNIHIISTSVSHRNDCRSENCSLYAVP